MKWNSRNVFILICLLIPGSAISQPDTLWTSTLDIEGRPYCESVLRTSDGYLIAGYVYDESYNYLVIKTDINGSLMWVNTYSDPTIEYCSAWEILEAPANDELYVFGSAYPEGASYSDIRILRIDADGNLLEETMFGGAFEDWVYAAAKTSDGGYIIAGAEGIYPNSMDIMLIKVDSQLDIEWQKEYGGTAQDYPSCVHQTSDGGYLVTGWTFSFGAQNADCYLLKTDSDGNVELKSTYGSPLFDRMIDVCETADGCYMGLWVKYNPSSTTIVQIDQQGTIEWQNNLEGRQAVQLLQNDDGTIVITGKSSQVFWLMLADNMGNQLWEILLNVGAWNHCGKALCSNYIGGYFVAGFITEQSTEPSDVWLLNFENYTGINIEAPAPVGLTISSVWPNPFQNSVILEYFLPVAGSAVVSVYDAAGRIVDSFDQSILPVGFSSFCWTPDETLPEGCYTLVLEACGETASRRCVLLR